MVTVTPQLEELAARSPDQSEHRRDEPYRRALIGVYARLAATARTLDQHAPVLAEIAPAQPYADAQEFVRDLEIIARLARRAIAPARLAAGRLRGLMRAAQVFGFHLAPLDLRQHSGVHEQVVAELFEAGADRAGYLALGEEERRRWLLDELAMPRPLRSPHLAYGELATERAADPGDRRASCSGATARARCPTTSSPRPTA